MAEVYASHTLRLNLAVDRVKLLLSVATKMQYMCGIASQGSLLECLITSLFSAGGRRVCGFQKLARAEVEPNRPGCQGIYTAV